MGGDYNGVFLKKKKVSRGDDSTDTNEGDRRDHDDDGD